MGALLLRFDNGAPAQTLRHTAQHTLLQAATEPDPEWVDDALLVISELVQNVFQHTRSGGELIITIEPGAVLIEVGDTGTTVPQPRHPSSFQVGGRGLLLIDAISQQWGHQHLPRRQSRLGQTRHQPLQHSPTRRRGERVLRLNTDHGA